MEQTRRNDHFARDAHAADFARECARGWRDGGVIAAVDLAGLATLARRLAADVQAWAGLIERLDLARSGPLDRHRAAELAAEAVFDEVLTPAAWRVLAAELRLLT